MSTTAADESRRPGGKRHYAWTVALATMAVLLFTSSTRGVFSLLIGPLMDEFGWSHGVAALPAGINLAMFGLIGPFAASWMARFGLRRTVSVALATVATGSLLSTQVTQPWHLVITWGLICGVGMGCMASILATTVSATWFVEKRGTVTGALMAGTTAGGLLFIQLNRALVHATSWRAASVVIGLAMAVSIPLFLAFVRDRPEDKGLRAYGAPEGYVTAAKPTNAVALALSTLRDVRTSGMFWILFGGFWVCGVTTSGMIQTHWFEAASDHAISQRTAANLLVVMGVCDLLGSLGSGWLCDRVDPRKLLFGYYLLRGLSLFLLEQVMDLGTRNVGFWFVIALYGLDWVATVPPTVALATQLFGAQRGGIVYGWLFAAHQLGGALAAWLAGLTRDWTGSFQLAYIVGGGLCILAAFGSLGIGREQHPIATPTVTATPTAA